MTPACLRFVAAALLAAAAVGCGPPTKAPPPEVEPTTAPITVPAFTPDPLPSTTGETTVLPAPPSAETAPTTGAATPAAPAPGEDAPKTTMKLPPATEPAALVAPAAIAAPVPGVAKPLVDPRLLVNGMSIGAVMRPKQTYDVPAFNTPEMKAFLQPPAQSFDESGVKDARQVELVVSLATLDPRGMTPSYVSVVKVTDKAAGDALVAGPMKDYETEKVGERTIYLTPAPQFQSVEAVETIEATSPALPDAPELDDGPSAPATFSPPGPTSAPGSSNDGCQDAPAVDPNAERASEPAGNGDPAAQAAALRPAVWRVDDVTFAIAPRDQLVALMKSYDAGTAADDELIALLSATDPKADVAVVFLAAPLRDFLTTAAQQLPRLPVEFQDVAKLPELVDSATLTVHVAPEPKLALAVRSPDAASSKRIEKLLNNGLQEVRPMWGFGKQAFLAQAPSDDLKPAFGWAANLVDRLLAGTKVAQVGEEATLTLGGLGTLDAILNEGAPHVRAMTEGMRKAADQQVAINNLKQIALAFHSHEAAFQTFPAAAVCDPNGKPLLSWRVAILPLIEQQELAQQFHLDEPWDSEHNKKLIEKMPAIYKSPGVAVEAGKTLFVAPTGASVLFDGGKKPKISEVADGLSNTLLVIEANPDQAVIWTKPDDLPIDLNALPNLGKARPKGFLAAFMDGAVMLLPNKLDPDKLKALLTPNGAEAVSPYDDVLGPDGLPPADVPAAPAPPKPE